MALHETVALFVVDKKECYYYDSFGFTYPVEVDDFCKGLRMKRNSKQVQHLSRDNCEEFCIYFLKEMNRGNKDLDRINAVFDLKNLKANDKKVEALIKT